MQKLFLAAILFSSFCYAETESFIQPKKTKQKKAIYLKQDIARIFKELHNILTDIVRCTGRKFAQKERLLKKIATTLREQYQRVHADFKKEVTGQLTSSSNVLIESANFLELIVDKMDELLEGNKNTFLGSAKRKPLQSYVISLQKVRDSVRVQAAQLRTTTA